MMIKKPLVMRIGLFLLMLTAMSLLVGVGISSLGLHGIPGMVTSGVLSFFAECNYDEKSVWKTVIGFDTRKLRTMEQSSPSGGTDS